MKPSRRLRLFAAAAALAASTAALAGSTFINILTGGTSGVYYPLGAALAQLYGQNIDGARTSVQATKASVENLNLLQAGRGELAFALGDSVADAWNGVAAAGFRTPLKDLRAIGAAYSNYIQLVASAKAGINTLADLKGKRISVGAPGSGSELNARAILKAAGLSYADLGKVEFLPYADSVELIGSGQLDATLQSSGLGMAAIRELAARMPVTFVAIPAEVVERIGSPAYQAAAIPAGTYAGQREAVPTVAIANILVTHAKVSEALAYQMTRLIFDNLAALDDAHAAARGITLESAARNLPIPLHPGAARFYREVGVLP